MANELKKQKQGADGPDSQVRNMSARGLTVLVVVLVAGLATILVFRRDFLPGSTTARPTRFALDLTDQVNIDPELIHYEQVGSIDLTMQQLGAIASGPDDKIYVAGDRAVHVFSADGTPLDVVELDSEPLCLFIGDATQAEVGRLFIGSTDGVRILGEDHQVLNFWKLPNENTLFTSIAVVGDEIFVADAGNRVVWRFSETGEVIGQIGKPDELRQIPGFVIPNRYFDIVAGSEGLLYCVNPGKLQVSAFSFDGDLGGSWGKAGSSVENFFGCCNPSHITRFGDGRFVTSERGIPRVKVYTTTGELESVVAGPVQLGISEQSVGDPRHKADESVFDIAVDGRGRVLVLDSRTRAVRIFALKDK